MNKKILVAGVGNVFLGDDGFGPAVASELRERTWPVGVEIIDFGIRGMDLAFALTSGLDAAILVDTVARGGRPGTLYVIEPDAAQPPSEPPSPHAMDPVAVLQLAASLGLVPQFIRVVGCEPADVPLDDGDVTHGLSALVEAAIGPAARLVAKLVREVQCMN